jgi:hypothetical protein
LRVDAARSSILPGLCQFCGIAVFEANDHLLTICCDASNAIRLRDGVDADVVGGPVGGEIAGEADQRSLDDRLRHGLHGLEVFGDAFFAIEALVRSDDPEIGSDVEDDAGVALDRLLASPGQRCVSTARRR